MLYCDQFEGVLPPSQCFSFVLARLTSDCLRLRVLGNSADSRVGSELNSNSCSLGANARGGRLSISWWIEGDESRVDSNCIFLYRINNVGGRCVVRRLLCVVLNRCGPRRIAEMEVRDKRGNVIPRMCIHIRRGREVKVVNANYKRLLNSKEKVKSASEAVFS